MTDNSMGIVDEIVSLSYVKVSEDVVGSNINEVKKEVNLWVDNNEEVEEVWDKA